MKKISRIISIMLFTIIAAHSNNLFAPYRPGKNQTPQQPQQLKQTLSQQVKGSGPIAPQTPAPKTNAQKKQEIAVLDKKVQQGTKQLADAVKKQKKAQTPEEKKLAKQEILKKAKEVMTFITQERNLRGELSGYSKEEVEAADAILAELEAKRDALAKVVNDLKKQQNALLVEGFKGRWFGSIKPGEEAKYNEIAKEINEYKPTLDKLNADIREQSIIAGAQKFTKTRAFVGAAAGTVLTAVALYTWLGPVAIGMELNEFKSNPPEYIKKRSAQFVNLTSGLFSSTAAKEAVKDAAGNALSEQAKQSILRMAAERFGQEVAEVVSDVFKMSKQMVLGALVNRGFQELLALINDQESTKEEVQAKALAVKKDLQRTTSQQ